MSQLEVARDSPALLSLLTYLRPQTSAALQNVCLAQPISCSHHQLYSGILSKLTGEMGHLVAKALASQRHDSHQER